MTYAILRYVKADLRAREEACALRLAVC